jgi:hypothetical protein
MWKRSILVFGIAGLSLLGLGRSRSLQAQEAQYDIVVYGGTSGGIVAAIAASRLGHSVALIEPSQHLGGLTTGGLGATDIGNKRAIGGMAREFYQRIHRAYRDPDRWSRESREVYFRGKTFNKENEDSMWTFEPHVASEVFRAWLAETQVVLRMGERLDRNDGVTQSGTRIAQIRMENGPKYAAKVFIDASYEGDLMAAAGVRYHVGRESNATYGETINGLQRAKTIHHQFTHQVDPFLERGNPASGLLPLVTANLEGMDGDGDHRIQAYNFRMCTTDVQENRLPWPKPVDYDEREFELLLRNFEAGDNRLPWAPIWMPNRKTDVNNNFAFSTDFIGMNYRYPEGSYAEREAIWRQHERYQKGLMWTLANHPRVPASIREVFQKNGPAADEFRETGGWPPQLYIREARRMVGEYVMSEKNCLRREVVQDSIGMGAYNMDSHNTQRYVDDNGFARNEGDVQIPTRPYPIAYRSICPPRDQCTNLLVPVCLSASHVAYGSIRMEPVFMVLGQSSATAASLCVRNGSDTQEIPYESLRSGLVEAGQVLDFE